MSLVSSQHLKKLFIVCDYTKVDTVKTSHQTNNESNSLLTVHAGALNVTVIPASDSPDWVLPSSLILSIQQINEEADADTWQGSTLPVYSLLADDIKPNKLIVLMSTKNKQPLGLLVAVEPEQRQLKIADISDIENASKYQHYPYVSEVVQIDSTVYIIPDMAALSGALITD